MQLKSNNNACKTPNLAVCLLLTLIRMHMRHTKHSSQLNSKIIARKSSRITWRFLRHMHECNKNRNMQLTPNLTWDIRLKQEIFLDFMIL